MAELANTYHIVKMYIKQPLYSHQTSYVYDINPVKGFICICKVKKVRQIRTTFPLTHYQLGFITLWVVRANEQC